VCTERPVVDDVTRIVVVWSSIAVFWEGISDTLTRSLGLNHNLMLLGGYVAVLLLMTVLRDLAESAAGRTTNEMSKVLVEDSYVAVSAVAGIMVWIGTSSRCTLRRHYAQSKTKHFH